MLRSGSIEMRKAIRGEKKPESDSRHSVDGLKKKYDSLEKEIWSAVKAGKLSKKDAGKKLAALKKEMFGGKEGHDKKDWDEKKDPDIEKLKRQLEALKRENERLRKRLEGRRRR